MSAERLRIVVVVDVVAALAADTLQGAVWLVDSNKTGGSTGSGTHQLKTTVREGDELVWTAMSLECEAFTAIESIEIDPAYCEVTYGVYDGTEVLYWLGRIKKDPGKALIPYSIHLSLGSRPGAVSLSGPTITGGRIDEDSRR